MRKTMFLIAITLLLLFCKCSAISIALADQYSLVMSNDDKVCQHMLGLYNDDLRKYRNIQYDKHEEFNQIKWKKQSYFYFYQGNKFKGSWNISQFDINADGKKDIIVKENTLFGGFPTETLYIFQEEDIGLFENEFDLKNIDKAINVVCLHNQ